MRNELSRKINKVVLRHSGTGDEKEVNDTIDEMSPLLASGYRVPIRSEPSVVPTALEREED